MRPRAISVVLALIASLAAVGVAGATPASAQVNNVASGSIIIEGLTLAGTQFGTPSGQPTTVSTDPLSIPLRNGDTFRYSTITCASPFPPWNSFGLHFAPNYPGVNEGPADQGASVRHELRGTLSDRPRWFRGVGTIRGTVTTFLCENGVRTDQIISRYTATIRPTSATSVPLVGGGPVPTTGGLDIRGDFRILYGTGRFEDLTGRGRMFGQFTCLPQTLMRNGTSSCRTLGGYSEVPFQLVGSFRDPTVQVSGPSLELRTAVSPPSGRAPLPVQYRHTVANRGTETLFHVSVADENCSPVTLRSGDVNGDQLLQPGETWTFVCSRTYGSPGTYSGDAVARGTSTHTGLPVASDRSRTTVTVGAA